MLNHKEFQRKQISFLVEIISKVNIKLLITLVSLGFLANSIYGNFDDLANQNINQREILWLFTSFIFTFLSIIINAYAWKLLINSIVCDINNLNIIRLFLTTNLYKYLPGGIWHFVSRYRILQIKLSNEKSAESILLEPLLMLVAGLIFIPFGGFDIYVFIICWSSPLIFVKRFREFIIKKMKYVKQNLFTKNYKFNYKKSFEKKSITKYPFSALFVEIIFLLFRFLGFLFCIKAFSVNILITKFELISSFSLAWIIGLVVPAAPGGMGVFESVILFELGSKLPEAPLLASLLCYRVVSTLSDIFSALVFPAKRLFKFKKN